MKQIITIITVCLLAVGAWAKDIDWQKNYDSALEQDVAAYDARRAAREPKAPGGLKNRDVYPVREGVGWSEDVARQLSVPERFGFAAYLKTKGFDLA